MKHRAVIVAVTVAMLFVASQSSATPWCAKDPHSKPDHPCDDDNDAVDAAATKFETQWKGVTGIIGVAGGQSTRGDYMEIEVTVEPPSLIPAIKAMLPTQTDGFPVNVVPIESGGVLLLPGIFILPDECTPPSKGDNSEADTVEPPSTDDDSQSDPFTEALEEGMDVWMDLPGVETVETARCGNCDCDPPAIEVTVQPSMMASIRKQIPKSKFGVPIMLKPSRSD